LGDNSVQSIAGRILTLRGKRVMVDADLAAVYGVTTKHLNQQVKRNLERFPTDFMWRLTPREQEQMWSQFVTTSKSRRRADNHPFVFTEHGCLMLSNVLRVVRAVETSVLIVRAFVRMRSAFDGAAELAARVDSLGLQIEKQGRVLSTHERAILKLLGEIRQLTRFPAHKNRPIGFTADIED